MIFVLIASVFFAGMATMIKLLGPDFPVAETVFFRNLLALPLLAWWVKSQGEPLQSSRWPELALRAFVGLLSMVCFFGSLPYIPLASAVMLNYSSPVFATVFAIAIMQERPTGRTILWLGIALAGVELIVQPTFERVFLAHLVALGSGIFAGAAYTATAYLLQFERPGTIVWHYHLVAALIALPFALWFWMPPTWTQAGLLLLISLAGTVGQLFLTFGFHGTPVARASTATLTTVIISAFAGWMLWQEALNWEAWGGIVLVGMAIVALGRQSKAPVVAPSP